MPKAQIYPGADATTQWFAKTFPGAAMDANCGCLHTTESPGWPGYAGGATAPNMTAKPDFVRKRLVFRQHHPVDRSSRALKNLTGGVETNTLNVYQLELVGTCDPKHRKSWNGDGKQIAGRHYIFWPDAPDWALRDLATHMVWLQSDHGIPASTPVKGATWTAYPESFGPGGQRFTNDQWRRLSGWCGHQHVPENVHGDPGAFPWARLAAFIGAPIKPAPTPAPVRPPIPVRGSVSLARIRAAFAQMNDDISNDTEQLQRALNARFKLKLRTDGLIDAATVAAFRRLQPKGVPYVRTLAKLGLRAI